MARLSFTDAECERLKRLLEDRWTSSLRLDLKRAMLAWPRRRMRVQIAHTKLLSRIQKSFSRLHQDLRELDCVTADWLEVCVFKPLLSIDTLTVFEHQRKQIQELGADKVALLQSCVLKALNDPVMYKSYAEALGEHIAPKTGRPREGERQNLANDLATVLGRHGFPLTKYAGGRGDDVLRALLLAAGLRVPKGISDILGRAVDFSRRTRDLETQVEPPLELGTRSDGFTETWEREGREAQGVAIRKASKLPDGRRHLDRPRSPRPMKPQQHHQYRADLRQQLVELARTGQTPEALAREFEPSAPTIRRWVKQAELDEARYPEGSAGEDR